MTSDMANTERRGELVIVKERTVRAVVYLPHGQRCETWLPKGLWKIDGHCAEQGAQAAILFRPAPMKFDGVWYVSPTAI